MYTFLKVCVMTFNFIYILCEIEGDPKRIVVQMNALPVVECDVRSDIIYEGDTIQLSTNYTTYISYASLTIHNKQGKPNKIFDKKALAENNGTLIYSIKNVTPEQYTGNWSFQLYISAMPIREPIAHIRVGNESIKYTNSKCHIYIEITKPASLLWVYIVIGVVALTIVILAQSVYIIKMKRKERLFLRDRTLQPKNTSENDGTRYSLTPRQRAMKSKKRGESGIYETLDDIKQQNGAAPVPPALETLPPRLGLTTLEKKQLLPSIPGSPISDQRTQDMFKEENVRIKDRPPLPLPCEDTYEEMETEENTYEPPPTITLPEHIRPRPPITNKLPPAFAIPLSLPGQRKERPTQAPKPQIPAKGEVLKPPKPSKPAKMTKPDKPAKPIKPVVKPKKSEPNINVGTELDTLLKKKRNDTNPPLMVNELDTILKKRRDVANQATVAPAPSSPAPSLTLPKMAPMTPVIARPNITNTQPRNQTVTNQAAAAPSPALPKKPITPLPARPTASNTNTQTKKQPAPPPIVKTPRPIPGPVPVPVMTQNNESNSSDDEWVYEDLPQYNIYSI